jgi:GMP synthase-like glutamine amidotransferase
VGVLILQLSPTDPPGRLADWLAAAGAEPRTVRVDSAADVPEQPTGRAGLVVLGGPMSAADETAELAAVRALLRTAVAAEVPTLGICLGAQLLAAAHGGRVEPAPDGPELGAYLVAKRPAAATDPLFAELPITPDVIQWHYDAITRLPAGAIHLAASPACENQAFRLGRLAWGIQFHIETEPDTVRRWAANDAGRLADYDLDRVLQRAEAVHEDVAEAWQPFVAAFAAVVRDPSAVPPPRGVRTAGAQPVTDPAAIRAALAAEAAAAHGAGRLPMPGLRPPDAD